MFKNWLNLNESFLGYVVAGFWRLNSATLNEGRENPELLQNRTPLERDITPTLFDRNQFKKYHSLDPKWSFGSNIIKPNKEICPITPLSGFEKHIKKLQQYAIGDGNPDQLAFTMMFSPLSANTPFAKHWDNMNVLKLILKHYFPNKINSKEDLESVLDGFDHYLHSLSHIIASFKFDTIIDIWNNRSELLNELIKLNKNGDDEAMMARLCQIKGVQPVKAGFIIQLLFGRAGCIDTHNIDIFTKVFPDMKSDFMKQKGDGKWTSMNWGGPDGIKNYLKTLDKLDKRGIGSKQLWDVWVDFVEHFYLITSDHGLGAYTNMGSSLDPNDPVYQALKNVKIPKVRVGVTGDERKADVPLVSGKYGMGASATHLPSEPDEMLTNMHRMYNHGEKGSEAARAIPFHLDKFGYPLERSIGMGTKPSALHYFGKAVKDTGNRSEVDPEHIRRIISDLRHKGGPKARRLRANDKQGEF